jgi:hypothetical protein
MTITKTPWEYIENDPIGSDEFGPIRMHYMHMSKNDTHIRIIRKRKVHTKTYFVYYVEGVPFRHSGDAQKAVTKILNGQLGSIPAVRAYRNHLEPYMDNAYVNTSTSGN